MGKLLLVAVAGGVLIASCSKAPSSGRQATSPPPSDPSVRTFCTDLRSFEDRITTDVSQNSTLRSLVSAVQKDAANAAEQLSSDAQSASGEPYDDGKDVVSAFNALSRTRPLDLMKVLVKMKNVSAHFVSAHCSS